MKVVNVKLVVKKDCINEYENFINDLVIKSRKETGNIEYKHFKEVGSENVYEIIEHWKNEKAIDQHNETEHFQNFFNNIDVYLDYELQIMVMNVQ
ncbi:putative quinol monooxygenase [Latilactobacillus sp. 5-91]|uniref:putative quinol monooxygenase n=1 Tax=Latilactobacillus sp. 5-91 TaxID=3410924 RepID=UPI003C7323E4